MLLRCTLWGHVFEYTGEHVTRRGKGELPIFRCVHKDKEWVPDSDVRNALSKRDRFKPYRLDAS